MPVQLLSILTVLLLGQTAGAVQIHSDLPVYRTAEPEALVVYTLRKGDSIETEAELTDLDYLQVHFKVGGKLRKGYIKQSDFERSLQVLSGPSDWGIGVGGEYTSLSQKGKNFEAADQVQYTTTNYQSNTFSPFLTLQWKRQGFWRFTLATKKTQFTAMATSNITGAKAQTVELDESFISGLLQKAWKPFAFPGVYVGLGGEFAKATSLKLYLGGTSVPTEPSDQPTYIGVQGFVGMDWTMSHSVTVFTELRYEGIFNQFPTIYMIEVAVGGYFWP